jgi:hypothetical protein
LANSGGDNSQQAISPSVTTASAEDVTIPAVTTTTPPTTTATTETTTTAPETTTAEETTTEPPETTEPAPVATNPPAPVVTNPPNPPQPDPQPPVQPQPTISFNDTLFNDVLRPYALSIGWDGAETTLTRDGCNAYLIYRNDGALVWLTSRSDDQHNGFVLYGSADHWDSPDYRRVFPPPHGVLFHHPTLTTVDEVKNYLRQVATDYGFYNGN